MSILKSIESLLEAIIEGDMPDKNELLYLYAKNHLGLDASPSDEAPDELACAETVEDLHFGLFGTYIAGEKTLSTNTLYKKLIHSPDWERVIEPSKGCIIISPTGYSIKNAKHGHVGIVGENGIIMSNNSLPPSKGIFLENFTVNSWKLYYRDRLGFPVYYFRRKA